MTLMDKIVSLAKRRGFVFPGSEIYGGLAGFYDFGPLGAELKFNIKQAWWKAVVSERDDVVGLSAAIIMNPKVWEASGHVIGFSDILVECSNCHRRFKADDFGEDKIKIQVNRIPGLSDKSYELITDFKDVVCESCGGKNTLGFPRKFNLMFKTFVGPVEGDASVAYLRPETAGGIFVNFKNILDTMRVKVPFGIAQIGRAFRNEINPKDFIFRTREFEQMELEYFVKPGHDDKAFRMWVDERLAWYKRIGLNNIHLREQSTEERAHYSKATIDIEYDFPFGRKEIEGIANRGNFDLQAHTREGDNLSYFDEETKERFIPYVIEPSAGVERILFALLCDAYHEEENRTVLRLAPSIAPYKVAVFPLLANKPELVERARAIYRNLKQHFMTAWDDRGNIGKRYYSQDEIGTPFCITVDFETLEDGSVTVRDRDTMQQERVKDSELVEYLNAKIK
ncbi:MAG: glycine--tRNA ligase [Candidatus Sungbacteria bacterium]|nr:glycine--tRNA ligase [Candidatus Sungbacteria bacterium]